MLQPAAKHTFLMENFLHRRSQFLFSFYVSSVSVQTQYRGGKHGVHIHKHLLQHFQFIFCLIKHHKYGCFPTQVFVLD